MKSEEVRQRDGGSHSSPQAPTQTQQRPPQAPTQPHPTNPSISTPICSICLDQLQWPVETNCGHLFCAQCILTHWEHDRRYPRACLCPNCRRPVTVLLYSDELRLRNAEVFEKVSAYNHQMNDAQGWLLSRIRDIPVLLRHLSQNFSVLSLWERFSLLVLALTVVVYLLSPIDLIPELIMGIFGFVDDFFAVIWALLYVTGLYRNHVING